MITRDNVTGWQLRAFVGAMGETGGNVDDVMCGVMSALFADEPCPHEVEMFRLLNRASAVGVARGTLT